MSISPEITTRSRSNRCGGCAGRRPGPKLTTLNTVPLSIVVPIFLPVIGDLRHCRPESLHSSRSRCNARPAGCETFFTSSSISRIGTALIVVAGDDAAELEAHGVSPSVMCSGGLFAGRRYDCKWVERPSVIIRNACGRTGFRKRAVVAWMDGQAAHIRFGSEADATLSNWHVRFNPESCRESRRPACPLWANNCREQVQQK